jgi:hypothetical protein
MTESFLIVNNVSFVILSEAKDLDSSGFALRMT